VTIGLTDFTKLRLVVEQLGVDWDEQTRNRLSVLWDGEIIEGRSEVIVTPGGLLDILPDGNVIRVVVHAPQGPYQGRGIAEAQLMEDPVNGWHKIHVLWCRTVDQWQKRLRKTNRNDGSFTYPLYWRNGLEFRPELRDGGRPLHLCRNCSQMLSELGIDAVPDRFDVPAFLTSHTVGGKFRGVSTTSDFDLVPNVYSAAWPQISSSLKTLRGWTCERCYVNLSDHKHLLHAHHRDHHKANNSLFNLQALCISCHYRMHPENAAFKVSPEMAEFNTLFPGRSYLQDTAELI
jgi:hypothetical protein